MKRLLLYVHFNKFNLLSPHVEYQLEHIKPLFSRVVFISNSMLSDKERKKLQQLGVIDDFIQRENHGFDFAAWRDGMAFVGDKAMRQYDSLTLMNDTCFGPLWDLKPYYQRFETDKNIDFWGMTNFRLNSQFKEHVQSYYLSFSKKVFSSAIFRNFWQNVQDYTDVQDVIENYESQVTTTLTDAGFNYQTVFNTINADDTGMLHPDFSYYNPTAILKNKVPFIKIKTIDANQHIAPYILDTIERDSAYPIDLIVSHMSDINYPDFRYLLGRKYLKPISDGVVHQKVAVHLHVFYVDLLAEFLENFSYFDFSYDLFITTDHNDKVDTINAILKEFNLSAEITVTGNIGRDVLPMLKLKDKLERYDYIGHFHTKKSKEADFWAGESWRKELIEMLVKPANAILKSFSKNSDLGLVIADIPTFFRYNKIVDAHNENTIAPLMNDLWEQMNLSKSIDFNTFHTFVMSYGTYVWFRYDSLKPLFELGLAEEDIPEEPLPQNSILHAIERLLVYIAWDRHYDFRIVENPNHLTAFIDNKSLNQRSDLLPHTYVNFDHLGGIRGAAKYIVIGPARAIKYIFMRLLSKMKAEE
ncbi:rhamnan synthesis F family protein [Streptococcus sciuri]|uniref:Rhamnan synthesis F family protein n=1 Tax=Streptococcus sciuri TaxID=2973939 RepID=A0ABT2F6H2_9STRE|nr:rhamnan synthesis F family protein [Streptococcus sciuri]MCS4488042.1 rhamnan synthesis F family protein [Streptococcus sciuri]